MKTAKEGEPADQHHRYWAKYGFALKDQETPDYEEAIKALNRAIRIRDAKGSQGFGDYEYVARDLPNQTWRRINRTGSGADSQRSEERISRPHHSRRIQERQRKGG